MYGITYRWFAFRESRCSLLWNCCTKCSNKVFNPHIFHILLWNSFKHLCSGLGHASHEFHKYRDQFLFPFVNEWFVFCCECLKSLNISQIREINMNRRNILISSVFFIHGTHRYFCDVNTFMGACPKPELFYAPIYKNLFQVYTKFLSLYFTLVLAVVEVILLFWLALLNS